MHRSLVINITSEVHRFTRVIMLVQQCKLTVTLANSQVYSDSLEDIYFYFYNDTTLLTFNHYSFENLDKVNVHNFSLNLKKPQTTLFNHP